MEHTSIHSLNDKELYEFLVNTPKTFRPEEQIRKFQLKNGDFIHCVLWNYHFYITGTDIVKVLIWRFQNAGKEIGPIKKFEEGIFSDLRNLKPGIDATLENPRSEFLEFLYKNGCIRTQKKQKVFYWYSVPHDALFHDALERHMRRDSVIYPYNIMGHESNVAERSDVHGSGYSDARNAGYSSYKRHDEGEKLKSMSVLPSAVPGYKPYGIGGAQPSSYGGVQSSSFGNAQSSSYRNGVSDVKSTLFSRALNDSDIRGFNTFNIYSNEAKPPVLNSTPVSSSYKAPPTGNVTLEKPHARDIWSAKMDHDIFDLDQFEFLKERIFEQYGKESNGCEKKYFEGETRNGGEGGQIEFLKEHNKQG